MLLFALALACAARVPDAAPAASATPRDESAPTANHPAQAHGAPGEAHGDHGRSHAGGDHATVDHSFSDAAKWSAVFDDPARDAWQKPAELVAALQIVPGSTVADIGAGTGYFNPHLSRAVGPAGRVIAVDIEASLVSWMADRAQKEGTTNVEARLGAADDPKLRPAEADLVLLVDTYHHIGERVAWFTRVRGAVKPGGRLVIVDFKPGDIPIGPPEEMRIPEAQVVAELTQAGWTDGGGLDLLPYQFVRVLVAPGGPAR